MMRQRQVLTSLLLGGAVVFVLGLGALAQSVSLTVTAYSDAIRFSAQGSVKELRVEILALSGQKVFDSGPVLGNALDWKLLNSQGQPVANGVYLYTVTVKDPSGNVTKKLGKLAVLRGKGIAAPPLSGITVGELASGRLVPQAFNATDWFVSGKLGVGTDTPTYKAEVLDDTDASLNQTVLRVSRQHPASGQNVQTFFQLENYGNNAVAGSHMRLAFARGSRTSPAAVMDGDRLGSLIYSGWDGSTFQNPAAVFGKVVGSVSAGSVPAKLTFETGACFSGCANPRAERMVIMPDGKVGIGTSSPTEQLTVAGIIYSTTGGIKFPDGTIQTTAATGAAAWALNGNAITAGQFLGTTNNMALEIKVNNARALRLEPNDTSPNIIGGFSGNSVTSGVVGATISGGGASAATNRVTDSYGTVGGGHNNQAGNADTDTTNAPYATVGGGDINTASGFAGPPWAGAGFNTASGDYATVGGGKRQHRQRRLRHRGRGLLDNTASGYAGPPWAGAGATPPAGPPPWAGAGQHRQRRLAATVGGGFQLRQRPGPPPWAGVLATPPPGDYSFVVGLRAKNTDPSHDGVFLFADSNNFDFPSTAANQFRVRATGGAQFVLGIDASGNPTWTCSVSNGTSWACSSDRNLKENF
jgi:hypothetical protein